MNIRKSAMVAMKEIYRFKEVPDWKDDIVCAALGASFLLLALSAIATLLNVLNIDILN